jgi:hypothetical protein
MIKQKSKHSYRLPNKVCSVIFRQNSDCNPPFCNMCNGCFVTKILINRRNFFIALANREVVYVRCGIFNNDFIKF